MGYVQSTLVSYQSGGSTHLAKAAGDVKLGPRSTASTQHSIKAGRLKGQLFACMSLPLLITSTDDQIPLPTKVRPHLSSTKEKS